MTRLKMHFLALALLLAAPAMAQDRTQIGSLPAATAVETDDLLVISQGGTTKQATVALVNQAAGALDSTTASTGAVYQLDDWSPAAFAPTTSATPGIVYLDTAAVPAQARGLTITGLVAGTNHRQVLLINPDNVVVCLSSEDSRSTAANRFRLPAGEPVLCLQAGSGALLLYDSNDSRWRVASVSNGGFSSPIRGSYTLYGPTNIGTTAAEREQLVTSGTGAAAARINGWESPFRISMDTGTTTTGYAAWGSKNLDEFLPRTGVQVFKTSTYGDTASDATNTYKVRIGMMDSFSGAPADGVFFSYTHSESSGNWQGNTIKSTGGGASGTCDTGQVRNTTWDHLAIVYYPGRDEAHFYVGDSNAPYIMAYACAITGGLPDESGAYHGMGGSIIKSAGTTSRGFSLYTLNFDWYVKNP